MNVLLLLALLLVLLILLVGGKNGLYTILGLFINVLLFFLLLLLYHFGCQYYQCHRDLFIDH
ncbi:hypothetical protein SNF32_15570 [Enterococcus mundtii]|nr:hypothetical protein [Enterococcus mundtii]